MLCVWHNYSVAKNMSENVVIFNEGSLYPNCSEHGAMNKVSKYGMWRCIMCHIGYDEETGKTLKNSSEGFKHE